VGGKNYRVATTHYSPLTKLPLTLLKPFALPRAAVIISPGVENAEAAGDGGLFCNFDFVAIILSRSGRRE
jgi:hypothetical protein